VLTTLLEDYLFELPSEKLKKISITDEVVRAKLDAIVHDEDLARYIL
jgi:ATP-dependent protease HslVU (ClpYQ) ATPase subunit